MSHTKAYYLWALIYLSFFNIFTSAVELVPVSNPEHIYGSSIAKRAESPKGELDLLNVETFYWAAPGMHMAQS